MTKVRKPNTQPQPQPQPLPPHNPAPTPDSKDQEIPLSLSKLIEISTIAIPFFAIFYYLIFYHYNIDESIKRSILINFGLSVVGFVLVVKMIPIACKFILKRNIFGYDINKRGTPLGTIKVPESLGIIVGIVFLCLLIASMFFNYKPDSLWLEEYGAALSSIMFMVLLGFVDDVLDIPWRVKLLVPTIATLPLLMAYAGGTSIVVPNPLRPYVGLDILELGGIYYLYMLLVAVFCTNSINIHAGLNGLEAGQTAVIASAILIHNIMQIGGSTDPLKQQAHAFSLYLVQPLLTTTLGLLCFNWYPSSVFVGDTYTYFAGMAMAVAGILGHFSETLLLFFIPQILNFLASCPQLFGFIKCPRHRLPSFNPESGLLRGTKDGTLINIFLNVIGPHSERTLCIYLLLFQTACCGIGFLVRYLLTGWYK